MGLEPRLNEFECFRVGRDEVSDLLLGQVFTISSEEQQFR